MSDWPSQACQVELVANRDGTLRLEGGAEDRNVEVLLASPFPIHLSL